VSVVAEGHCRETSNDESTSPSMKKDVGSCDIPVVPHKAVAEVSKI